MLHAYLAFFKQLGGFAGIGFLSSKYLIAIGMSFFALLIFTIMAATATDKMIERIGFTKWKMIHRFIYLAAFLVLVHALMLGTHFVILSAIIPKIFFIALAFLLILEARRIDDWLFSKYLFWPKLGFICVMVFATTFYFLLNYVFSSSNQTGSLGIHSQHILQANKDAESGVRLSVSMKPEKFVINKKGTLEFRVFNAANGEVVEDFLINQEKIMHLIIVDESLSFFDHVHPSYKDGVFAIDYTFTKNGKYRIYTDFLPKGMSEQYFAFELNVGNVSTTEKQASILSTEDVVDGIKATMTLPKDFNSKDVAQGKTIISFKLVNKDGGDVNNIETYLGAFGHLVMIRQDTFEYIHVHPKQTYQPYEGEMAGPVVEFSPLSIYGNVKPGVYKMFAQFKIDGKDYVFDYLVKLN